MRIITSKSVPTGRRNPGYNPRDAAARAAIEREYARYIPLVCGHYSDLETDMLYANWRPRRKVAGRLVKVSYCEKCGDWQQVKPPPKPDNDPDEPLF